MKIEDIPPFHSGDIIELIKHNSSGEPSTSPEKLSISVEGTRRTLAIILEAGVSDHSGYVGKEYVLIANGLIDGPDKRVPLESHTLYLDLVDEINVYPRQE